MSSKNTNNRPAEIEKIPPQCVKRTCGGICVLTDEICMSTAAESAICCIE